ncbi:efflux RND transporter permease subunit [Bacillus thuringiensis]|uniref:efflux RND transporter permease subunit n=1 Tax=Bacillus thuringiensis TaxID=1428 RepID=UPI0021D66E9C|nr:efflux RND transporter permease subunit [Bacillus thuringiensis]MCU7666787.1 efflux RND transporter permease subunit [Bacillus thuringiensis]
MNFLTRFSLKNPAAIVIITILVALGGIFSAVHLKKETMPDISIPIVAIITPYPGASPNDILDDVTKPVEDAIMKIEGVENVNSTSTENVSAVIAQFSFSTDMDEAKRNIEDAVKKLKLPEKSVAPQITRISFGSFPILKYSISNQNMTPEELEKLVKKTVVKNISGLEGVGQAQLSSDTEKSIYVKLLPEKLKEYSLTSEQVLQQIQAHNVSFPVGGVTIDGTVKPIRIAGNIQSLDELKNLQIPIYPNQQDEMKKAFEKIGDGMNSLGKAVGDIGNAVGQLGQGLAGATQGLNGEIQLVSAIHDTESQLIAARLELNDANKAVKNPQATEQEKAVAMGTIQQLAPQVQIGETALAQMKNQLKEVQKQMAQGTKAKVQEPKKETEPKKEKKEEKPKIKQIALKDLAEVTISADDTSAISRTNGKNSVGLDVLKTQDSNTVDVADVVKKEMNTLKEKLPKGTEVKVIFDQSTYVKESINSMIKEGLMGAAFACIVILLFLRNFRSTFISVISIPLSLLIAMVFLKQANITLNIMTLGGIALAVGRVVDDSIVVIENVYRNLQKSKVRNVDVIKMGTKEVAKAITTSTITTIAVFLPLGLVDGMIGKVFKPFALTVCLSLLASLIVAVTIVPLMAKFMLLRANLKEEKHEEGKMIKAYQRVLKWSLNHKIVTLLISFGLFAGSLAIVPLIGTSFMPASEEKYISVSVEYPIGTEISITNKKIVEIEKTLEKDKDITMFQTTIGTPKGNVNPFGSIGGSNSGSIFLELKKDADVDKVVKHLRKELITKNDKAKISVTQTSPGGDSGSSKIEVVVKGTDIESIKKGARLITKELKKVDGLDNVTNNINESKPEISIEVNQKKASKQGLSTAQIGGTIRDLLGTNQVGSMTVNKEDLNIQMGLKLDPVKKLNDIKELSFTTALGEKIELQQIATVKEVPGPVSILTKDGEQYASVSASITDKNTGAVTEKVQQVIDKLDIPKGVDTQIGGTVEQMNESFQQLGLAIVVAIGAVYLTMVIAFGEAKAPFAILFSLPLAMIGGFAGLLVARIPLDMPAMIGFLMLIGIVVTNAIVLVDRIQERRREGLEVREALIEAGTVRMRPILMTALATIGALSPLALGLSKGSIMSQSLSIVVIGGLITSTLLTLIVVPVMYELLNRRKKVK